MWNKSKNMKKGFSIIELVIMLIIISILLSMSFSAITSILEVNSYLETRNKIKAIKTALATYKNKYGRLPCPADITTSESSATYMTEVSSCTTANCASGVTCPSNVAIGAIPATSLGFSSHVGIDGWGNKIFYAVDQRFTAQTAKNCEVTGNLIIVDNNGNQVATNGNAEYVVVSAGKDMAGAYSKDGTVAISCNSGYLDGINCSNSGATFRDGQYSDSYDANHFDDIMDWAINNNAQQCPAGLAGCKIWLDAADTCSVTESSGLVSAWQDKSINNFIANSVSSPTSPTYVTTTLSLTNGKPYLQFASASTNLLSISFAAPTIPASDFSQTVVFIPSTTSTMTITNIANSNTYNASPQDYVFGTNISGATSFTIAGGSITDFATAGNTNPTIATVKVSSTSGTSLFINGTQVATSSTISGTLLNPTNFNIGGNSSLGAFNGKILEIVFYNRVLSSIEQQQLENHLANKWNGMY